MGGRKVWVVGWFALVSLWSGSAEAVTLKYDAVVTFSIGPHSSVFHAGDKLVISYTLDPHVLDAVSDPKRGVFPSAVLSMSVTFPDRGVFAVAGPSGSAQTFDNFVDPSGQWSDQIFFFGGPISSASRLDGKAITSMEVDFGSEFLTPPDEPSVLASDALPLFALPINNYSTLFLGTNRDYTQVSFAAVAPSPDPDPPRVPALTSTQYPNFRFWVRISDARIGTSVAGCLPETVCVAGTIPTRAEVFVRIVGPKPNGRLWPSIVKFNTTKTEVWIQQITTGMTKYYLLPALPTDSGILPGVVDSQGFLP